VGGGDTAGTAGDSGFLFSCSERFTRRSSSYDIRLSMVLSGKREGSGASPTSTSNQLHHVPNKKLCYHRQTMQRVVTVTILSAAAQLQEQVLLQIQNKSK